MGGRFKTEGTYVCLWLIHVGVSGLDVKNLPAMQETEVLIPGSGRSPGGGYGNSFQYFCLENPMDRGPWQATVHRVAKSQT